MLNILRTIFINKDAAAQAGKRLLLLVFCVALIGSLSACGKKPGQVDAPMGAPDSGFPHVYPDPSTDPS